MTVAELKQLLQRFPESAAVTVRLGTDLLGVERATLDFTAKEVEIDPQQTWQEQAGALVRLVLTVESRANWSTPEETTRQGEPR